jgi:hypothetical protein
MRRHTEAVLLLMTATFTLFCAEALAEEDAAGDPAPGTKATGEDVEPPIEPSVPDPGPALAPGGTSLSEPDEPAPAEEVEEEGVDMDDVGEEEIEEEVIASASASGQVIQHGNIVYSAMGAVGLAVIDVSTPLDPRVIRTIPVEGGVKALQIVDETLVVILEDFTTMPFDISDPASPVPQGKGPGQPSEPAPAPLEGKVGKVKKGWVILDIGREDGVEPGMKFAIYGSESGIYPRAVVTIAEVTDHNASAPLPPRGDAAKGDRAVKTSLTWRSKYWMSPFPEPGYFKMALDFKPIIGVEQGAGSWGFISELELMYKFKAPAELALVLRPGGFAMGDTRRKGGVFEFGAMGGVNHRFIAYTWGVGGHLSVYNEERHVLLLNKIRMGNADGFHVEFFLTWVVPGREGEGMQRILPTTSTFTIDIPIRPKLSLYLQMGGGNLALLADDDEGSGWANFIIGVRSFLRGAGGSGTLILTTGAGLGYVWDHNPRDETPAEGGATWGPLIHLGLDWRP